MKGFTASDGVVVERSANGLAVHTPLSTTQIAPNVRDALMEYFREAKPWQDAKPWETWAITIDGEEFAVTLDDDREFRDRRTPGNGWAHITDPAIAAARRIWPEVTP